MEPKCHSHARGHGVRSGVLPFRAQSYHRMPLASASSDNDDAEEAHPLVRIGADLVVAIAAAVTGILAATDAGPYILLRIAEWLGIR